MPSGRVEEMWSHALRTDCARICLDKRIAAVYDGYSLLVVDRRRGVLIVDATCSVSTPDRLCLPSFLADGFLHLAVCNGDPFILSISCGGGGDGPAEAWHEIDAACLAGPGVEAPKDAKVRVLAGEDGTVAYRLDYQQPRFAFFAPNSDLVMVMAGGYTAIYKFSQRFQFEARGSDAGCMSRTVLPKNAIMIGDMSSKRGVLDHADDFFVLAHRKRGALLATVAGGLYAFDLTPHGTIHVEGSTWRPGASSSTYIPRFPSPDCAVAFAATRKRLMTFERAQMRIRVLEPPTPGDIGLFEDARISEAERESVALDFVHHLVGLPERDAGAFDALLAHLKGIVALGRARPIAQQLINLGLSLDKASWFLGSSVASQGASSHKLCLDLIRSIDGSLCYFLQPIAALPGSRLSRLSHDATRTVALLQERADEISARRQAHHCAALEGAMAWEPGRSREIAALCRAARADIEERLFVCSALEGMIDELLGRVCRERIAVLQMGVKRGGDVDVSSPVDCMSVKV
jgi:hypothetical protein